MKSPTSRSRTISTRLREAARAHLRLATAIAVTATVALGCGSSTPAYAAAGTQIAARDYGYPYPAAPDCDETPGSMRGCSADKWGFFQGQCVSWVAYRLNSLSGVPMSNLTYKGQHWSGAFNWGAAARRAGIRVDSTPKRGSVAWYSNHVAFVERVNANGSVLISEMNHDNHNGFALTTISRSYRWPKGFIHFKDLPSSAPAKVTAGVQYAVDAAGNLWDAKVPVGGGAASRTPIGHGWQSFSLITEVSDVNGDGQPDIVARSRDWRLWLFATKGKDHFAAPRVISTKWAGAVSLTDAGALTGRGHHLVALLANGAMYRYSLSSTALSAAVQIKGPTTVKSIAGVGDIDLSGTTDLVGVTSSGALIVYRSTLAGQLDGGHQVGTTTRGATVVSNTPGLALLSADTTLTARQVAAPAAGVNVAGLTGMRLA